MLTFTKTNMARKGNNHFLFQKKITEFFVEASSIFILRTLIIRRNHHHRRKIDQNCVGK